MAKKKNFKKKTVETLTHDEAGRLNIPTAELQPVVGDDVRSPIRVAIERRNRDLDPQLVWRGKDEQDWSDLVVHAPPLYIQEKVHPKALIDDLMRFSRESRPSADDDEPPALFPDLFADFNGLPEEARTAEFYQHEGNWTNRMILGDSLQVMASLAEREGLRGKVQCIYIDPPYGIKFNSNFQWSTTSRDVKDGKADHITREPEQVKAFRDTWRDGIHSYLTYLRDRLTVARDLLTESGSVFVQIGDENVHRVRALMDEVFGERNYVSTINFATTGGLPSAHLSRIGDFILLYAKNVEIMKWRRLKEPKKGLGEEGSGYNRLEIAPFQRRQATPQERDSPDIINSDWRVYSSDNLNGQGPPPEPTPFVWQGRTFNPAPNSHWKPSFPHGLERLARANRAEVVGNNLRYVRFFDDNPSSPIKNIWLDTSKAGFASSKSYVVETNESVVERCVLMTTDPGDLVLDPTCGSGTTAYVAEQWGRRWITIDTSRVALALARARIMGARYPYYLLADEVEDVEEVIRSDGKTFRYKSDRPGRPHVRQGFIYQRVPHITLKSIANNAEIDVIWEKFEERLLPLRKKLTSVIPGKWLADYRKKQKYTAEVPPEIQEWEIPREFPGDWPENAKALHEEFWKLRIERQREIDASIAAHAEFEYLYDKPYEDKSKVRVAGPFTVESLSPHRYMGVDENDELIRRQGSLAPPGETHSIDEDGFVEMILENLKVAGVQQAHKEDKIDFTSLVPWPGELICAEGRYLEGEKERRAGIFIGPEFGTVQRQDLVQAAREAADAGFDVLIACAFSYDAHSSELNKLGRIPVLKARMNADLHMASDLKESKTANLFVIFGEPDVDILHTDDGRIQVRINGVDVFDPSTGEVRSDGPEGIACWFIDTDYNEESFFVRHAYFLGANDPYKSLKTTLKAEIDEESWASLNSAVSRPFEKPKSGRIAVKVINHLGDEVMKVFRV
ncbi:MAG: site-specific DNA-methyltransferase [Gemmatales bacterium]|nr:MAG: site-specific DNA-methyltransferase [Gemmatales bacterium]